MDAPDANLGQMEMTRVLVIAEVRLHREGLKDLIGRERSMQVVGAASSLEEAVPLLRDSAPDIALVDLRSTIGPRAVPAIVQEAPEVRVVAFGVHEVEDEILLWVESGVSGYVRHDASVDDLVATLQSVADGEMQCSPRIGGVLLRRLGALAARLPLETDAHLTLRERQVMDLIEQGLSNKEIARHLHLSLATVKNHVHNIFAKLQVHRRAEALSRLGRRYHVYAPGE